MPTNIPWPNTNLRWWFHSRPADKLNSLSYWLLASIPAVFFYVLLTFALPPIANHLSQARSDSEYLDWITSPLPKTLVSANASGDASFINRFRMLADKTQYGNSDSQTPLYQANSIQKDGKPCVTTPGQEESMFANGEILVYPTCATFTLNGAAKLTKSERIVFSNFAAYMTSIFKNTEDASKDPKNSERTLARAFGLSASPTDPLDVPWVYVASYPSGAITVFPGTTVISGRPAWETTSRPWYKAALKGESQLASRGLRDIDLLTVAYSDILAKKPILVRTYLYKFDTPEPTPGRFVVAVDFYRREGAKPKGVFIWGEDLASLSFPTRLGITVALSLVFFAMVRWTSTNHSRLFVFERLPESRYGMVDLKRTLQLHKQRQAKSESSFGVSFAQYGLTGGLAGKKEQEEGINVETAVEESAGLSRGVEWWSVFFDQRTAWRLFWLRFESVRRKQVGQTQVIYTKAILPQVTWMSFDDQVFSEPDAIRHFDRLPAILKQNADSWDGGYFEISDIGDRGPSSLHIDRIPEWVRSVVRAEEVFAVRQGRAYVTLTSTRLDELYSRADVKAVILARYFERLLKHGQIDFLLRGRTIYRVVSFPDEATQLQLSGGTAIAAYETLLNSYSPIRSRTLVRSNGSIDVEGIAPQPVYDFAILDDQMLVVTHTVMEASLIDVASGREEKPTYRVEGYISWRKSDMEFYRQLFEELARSAKPFSTSATQAG